MTIGENIKYYRELKGMTQAELANAVKTTSQNISQYEREVRTPKIETLKKIAEALEVEWVYFYPDEDDSVGNKLKSLRMLSGHELNEVSEKIGVSVDEVSAWENGKKVPSFAERLAYASAIGFQYFEVMSKTEVEAERFGEKIAIQQKEKDDREILPVERMLICYFHNLKENQRQVIMNLAEMLASVPEYCVEPIEKVTPWLQNFTNTTPNE